MGKRKGELNMTENTNQWIETVKDLSGEKDITKELILGVIEMVECSLMEEGSADDLLSLDELTDMLRNYE